MNKVSESIFSGKVGVEKVIIPLAEVQAVTIEDWGTTKVRQRYHITLKNTQIVLKHHMGKKFMKEWLFYRHEIEGGTKGFKNPEE